MVQADGSVISVMAEGKIRPRGMTNQSLASPDSPLGTTRRCVFVNLACKACMPFCPLITLVTYMACKLACHFALLSHWSHINTSPGALRSLFLPFTSSWLCRALLPIIPLPTTQSTGGYAGGWHEDHIFEHSNWARECYVF
jgi:hypothetical protein